MIEIRISGARELVDQVAEDLRELAHVRVLDVSPPFANRKDPGVRRYVKALRE